MKKFFAIVSTAVCLSAAVLCTACGKGGENGDGAMLTKDNLSSLAGKTVGVVQLSNVPGLTLQAVLKKHNIAYQIIESPQAEKASDKVNLVAVEAANVTPVYGCDYYLCPEPAATTKITATASGEKSLVMAGDLQALYGENGYPQAVLVAKNEIVSDVTTGTLVSYFEGSVNYLSTVEPSTVLSALDGVRTSGLAPSFNANNLNATVIANCSVRYGAAATCKNTVNTFLAELAAVNANASAAVADEFYYTGNFTAQSATTGKRTVYAPDGAPALSLCNAIAANSENFEFHVIDASTVQAQVTGANPVADYCVLPVNLASKLLGNGSVYQMLGTVTNGNLYFLTTKTNAGK